MYSTSDFNKMIEQYLKTDDGKQMLKKNGLKALTDADIIKIATDLKNEIVNTFLSMTKHDNYAAARNYFNNSRVYIKHLKSAESATMVFTDAALFRPSFLAVKSKSGQSIGYTGSGVNDIFELFTNGISRPAKSDVYGYWAYTSGGEMMGTENIYRAKKVRRANPFISNTVKKFTEKYNGLEIILPEEWQ